MYADRLLSDRIAPPRGGIAASTVQVLLLALLAIGVPVFAHAAGGIAVGLPFAFGLALLIAGGAPAAMPVTVVFAFMFQNAAVAAVSPYITDQESFNLARSYNFIIVATFWGVVVLGSIALVAGGLWSYQALSESAELDRKRVEDLEKADGKIREQLLLTRRHAYVANIQTAQRSWDDLQPQRVDELLTELLPPEGQPDLRGFEWYYLRGLVREGMLTLPAGPQFVAGVTFRGDGRQLLTLNASGPPRLWNATNGKEVVSLRDRDSNYAYTATFNADGRRVLEVGSNGQWRLWDVVAAKPILNYGRKNVGLTTAVFSPNGKLVGDVEFDVAPQAMSSSTILTVAASAWRSLMVSA